MPGRQITLPCNGNRATQGNGVVSIALSQRSPEAWRHARVRGFTEASAEAPYVQANTSLVDIGRGARIRNNMACAPQLSGNQLYLRQQLRSILYSSTFKVHRVVESSVAVFPKTHEIAHTTEGQSFETDSGAHGRKPEQSYEISQLRRGEGSRVVRCVAWKVCSSGEEALFRAELEKWLGTVVRCRAPLAPSACMRLRSVAASVTTTCCELPELSV